MNPTTPSIAEFNPHVLGCNLQALDDSAETCTHIDVRLGVHTRGSTHQTVDEGVVCGLDAHGLQDTEGSIHNTNHGLWIEALLSGESVNYSVAESYEFVGDEGVVCTVHGVLLWCDSLIERFEEWCQGGSLGNQSETISRSMVSG